MNARAAAVHTARRAGRFNLVAAIVVIAAIAVFAVKAQAERENTPARHFAPWSAASASCVETHEKITRYGMKSHAVTC